MHPYPREPTEDSRGYLENGLRRRLGTETKIKQEKDRTRRNRAVGRRCHRSTICKAGVLLGSPLAFFPFISLKRWLLAPLRANRADEGPRQEIKWFHHANADPAFGVHNVLANLTLAVYRLLVPGHVFRYMTWWRACCNSTIQTFGCECVNRH